MSLHVGRLVTYAARQWPTNGLCAGIAADHDTIGTYLDLWQLSVEDGDWIHWHSGIYCLSCDLPADRVKLVRSGKLER